MSDTPVKTMTNMDTLANLLTGMGMLGQDRSVSRTFASRTLLKVDLDNMYRNDWIARKIVDIPAFDMTRKRRQIQLDINQITAIEAAERKLKLWAKIRQALTWERLYGGAAIIIDDGSIPSSPLNPERASRDRLKALHVVSRFRLQISDQLEGNLQSPNYGQPVMYTMTAQGGVSNSSQIRVHPSRVIAFRGIAKADLDSVDEVWWGDSVLQSMFDALVQAAAAPQGFSALIDEAKTDLVFIKDLPAQLQSQQTRQLLLDRFLLFRQAKSMNNVALFDQDTETHEQRTVNFANHDAIIMVYLLIASGAADIPATRMLGQAPQGLNATGEGDLRNYYNSIESRQDNDLRDQLDQLDLFVIPHAIGSIPKEYWYTFTPLWTPTQKEQAETTKIKVETALMLAGSQVVNQPAVQKGVESLIVESELLPGFEQALKEFQKYNPDPETLIASLENPSGDEDEEDEDELEDPTDVDPAAAVEAASTDSKRTKQVDATPRTLYIYRKVLNAADIIAWAREQNFKTSLPADDLHVTIAFSRQLVDWMQMPIAWEDEIRTVSGPRLLERLGPTGDAVVLMFNHQTLQWRHNELRAAGASWDFPEYQPHITITYNAKDRDLSAVAPYQGPIELGPEIWEEVDDDWKGGVKERPLKP